MSCKHRSSFFVGSTLKFAVTIERDGFNMAWDPWKITVIRGDKSVVCDRDNNTVFDENDQWYFLVDTAILGVGTYKVKIDIDVPDDDYPSGYSHEVYGQNLIKVKAS